MGLLQKAGTGQGFLTAAGLGFSGSGKTYTGTLLAVVVRDFFGDERPVAMVDSEGGSEYVAPTIKALTGTDLLVKRTRSFDDLMAVAEEAQTEASVLVVDSATHFWRDICNAYLARINEVRAAKDLPPRRGLEFQDWSAIKDKWAAFPNFILNSKIHTVTLGRAGYEWDFNENEETGKKELVKTGIKMKSEGEFTYEPSLVFNMEREQVMNDGSVVKTVRTCTVLKDRFGVLDGAETNFDSTEKDIQKHLAAVKAAFLPHLERLKPGAYAPVDTSLKTDPGVTPEGDAAFHAERRQRAIACEKIAAELDKVWAGTSAAAKKGRADAIDKAFGTRSWTEIESMRIERLREGFVKVVALVKEAQVSEEAA